MNSTAEQRTCPNCGAAIPANAPQGVCPKCLMAAAAVSTEAGQTGGKRPEAPSLERLAAAFPQLEVMEFIGQGGMGAVYKARQKQLDRIVALKVLPPGIGGDPSFAGRFTREAKALAKLLHPNIVALFEFGQADGIYYLLMEFVDGVSLGQLLRASRVSAREALAIVPQICDALQYAHDQGIVHRDIKPENIMLDRRGRVKVADFGLAKLVESNTPTTSSLSPSDALGVATKPREEESSLLTAAGKIMGTPNYMAPEQVEHPGEVDHRADIYALGVVFYQMLTGELPGKRLEPPSRKVQIDVRLDDVVMRALEKDPGRRYSQASAFKTQVETIATSIGASFPTSEGPLLTARQSSAMARPSASQSLKLALLTLAWHTVLFFGVLLFFLLIVPRFMDMFRVFPVHLSYLSLLTFHFYSFISQGGFLLFPVLLAIDGGICFLAQDVAGNVLRRVWSVVVLCGCGIIVLVSAFALYVQSGDSMITASTQSQLVDVVKSQRLKLVIVVGSLGGALAGLEAGALALSIGGLRQARRHAAASLTSQAAINEAEWSSPRNWIGPKWFSVYFSKRDSRAWVPKRIPAFGWTVNLGSPRGAFAMTAILGTIIIVLAIVPLVIVAASHPAAVKFMPFIRTSGGEALSSGPVKQVSATTAYRGDLGVRLNAIGTVESSNSVMFVIPEQYCQEVIKKFDAHQALAVEADNRQGERFGHGFLAGVDNRIDPETATLKCRASLAPAGENLMVPGLFLNIHLLLDVKHGVIFVPAAAILRDPQGAFVWAIKPDQTVSVRHVQAGTTDGAKVEIQNGLSPGEAVVTDGSYYLREGQKVYYKQVLPQSDDGK